MLCLFCGEMMKKQIANILTGSRFLCSFGLLCCPVFSGWFYTLYLLCGVTDMVDGTIARRTGSVSEFGARLDTAADLAFAVIAFLKILPRINLQKWLWYWVITIGAVKICNYLWYFKVDDHIQSLHTIANKITGFSLFFLPLTQSFLDLRYSAPAVCILATLTVIQELSMVLKAFLKREVSR